MGNRAPRYRRSTIQGRLRGRNAPQDPRFCGRTRPRHSAVQPAGWTIGWGEVGCQAQGGPAWRQRGGSRPISRVLSRTTIHLGRTSPCASSDLPGSPCGQQERARRPARFPIWSCSRWGLPCRRMLPPARCALTAPFHPCRHCIAAMLGRFAFCCTFRGLAPPRRYLAPCPVEPGLSSAQGAAVAWPTPATIIPVCAAAGRVRRVPCAVGP